MTDEVVRCDFQAGGISQAKEAFRTYEQGLARLEKLAAKQHDSEERGILRVAKTEREAATSRVKSAVTAEDARAEIAKRGAQKRLDAEKHLFEGLAKLEKEHTKIAEAEAKKRAAAEAAANKAVEKRRTQMGSALTGGLARGVGRPIQAGIQYGGMAVGMAGGFALADAAKGYMTSDAAARGLAISMYQGDGPDNKEQQDWLKKNGKNGRFDSKELMATAATMSAASGVDKTQLLGGLQQYVALSSDWEAMAKPEMRGSMTELAKMSTATGTDFGQMMSAAGSMRMQNPNLKPDQMVSLMRSIVGQGKVGAVEISDLAKHASTITASAGQYAGTQQQSQTALLGLAQIARRASGDPAIAATSVARFAQDISQHAAAAKTKGGYDKYDPIADHKSGALKAPSEILAQMFDLSKGDFSTFGMKDSKGHKGFGLGLESIHVAQGEIGVYKAAKELATAGGKSDTEAHKAGVEAVRADVRKVEHATYSKKDVDADFATVVEGAGKKIEMATARIKAALEVKMAPIVERLADSFLKNEKGLTTFAESLAKAVGFLIENPWEGIGLLVAASISREIARAAIGQAITNAMQIPAVNAAAGRFAAACGVMSVAALAVAVTMHLIDAAMAEKAKRQTEDAVRGGTIAEKRIAFQAKVKAGTATAEDQAAAKKDLAEASAAVQKSYADSAPENRGIYETAQGAMGAIVDGKGMAEAQQTEERASRAEFERSMKEVRAFNDAIAGSTAAVMKFRAAAAAADPANPNRNGPIAGPPRGGTEK